MGKDINFYSKAGRDWHRQRIREGMAEARKAGTRIGRPRINVPKEFLEEVSNLPAKLASARLGISVATLRRLRQSKGRNDNG